MIWNERGQYEQVKQTSENDNREATILFPQRPDGHHCLEAGDGTFLVDFEPDFFCEHKGKWAVMLV